ncbi:hypothetical protein Dimus_028424 [Dionaea muscipula]
MSTCRGLMRPSSEESQFQQEQGPFTQVNGKQGSFKPAGYFSLESLILLMCLTASLLILPLILPPLPPPPSMLLLLPIGILAVLAVLAFMPCKVRNIAAH